jgi:hypothetical protein
MPKFQPKPSPGWKQAAVRVASGWSKSPLKVFLLAFNWVANYHGRAAKHAVFGLFSGVILSNS